MTTDQKNDEIKTSLPVLTADLVKLKINGEIAKNKLSLQELEKRALSFVKNRDNLKAAADFFKDTEALRDIANEVHTTTKKPYLEGGNACDAGRKLILKELDRVEGMVRPWYDEELELVDRQKREKDLKKAQIDGIHQIIEDNVINFSNRIVAAVKRKDLIAVESLINLEKSASMAKKYGEFHQRAIERYDNALLPIIKDQKLKIEELEKLNALLQEAEANNDPDKMDEIDGKINALTNEILQNHALVQDAALHQEGFPVIEVEEVLPPFKVKRTNFSFEIADVDVALKKSRDCLEIGINKEGVKVMLARLRAENAFADKDEVIVDGIKYIATKVREAL